MYSKSILYTSNVQKFKTYVSPFLQKCSLNKIYTSSFAFLAYYISTWQLFKKKKKKKTVSYITQKYNEAVAS